MSDKFIELRRSLLDRLIDQLNIAGEIFITVLVAFPILMITLMSIMGFFGGEVLLGLSAPTLMNLIVYVLIPFAAMAVLLIIDIFMASW